MGQPLLKSIATALSLLLFTTNGALAHAPEANFWGERRKSTQQHKQYAFLNLNASSLTNVIPAKAGIQALTLTEMNVLDPGFRRDDDPNCHLDLQKYGSFRKITNPKSQSSKSKTIIHIQDIHLNREAQLNIGRAVQELIKTNQVDLIALEGAFAPINLRPFHHFPHQNAIKKVADYLLEEDKISGPIHAALTVGTNTPSIIGIDDLTHYHANVDAYRQAAKLAKAYKKEWERAARALEKEKIKLFNPKLKEFDQTVELYRRGEIKLGEYIRKMRNAALTPHFALFLQALDIESSLNFAHVDHDRSQILERLMAQLSKNDIRELIHQSVAYRLGNIGHRDFYGYLTRLCKSNHIELSRWPAMDAYLKYVLLCNSIDGEALFQEMRQEEAARYNELAQTKEEKQLIAESRRLYLMGKLLDFALTQEEWEEYRTLCIVQRSSPKEDNFGVGELSSFESFYREAEIRDQKMAQNFINRLPRTKNEVRRTENVSILVTGGFHAHGITDRLTQAGFTVVSFVPKITKIDTENGSAYLSVFQQEQTPLEKLFEGEKLFLAGKPIHVVEVAAGGIGLSRLENRNENHEPHDQRLARELGFERMEAYVSPQWEEENQINVELEAANEASIVKVKRGAGGKLSIEQKPKVQYGFWKWIKKVARKVHNVVQKPQSPLSEQEAKRRLYSRRQFFRAAAGTVGTAALALKGEAAAQEGTQIAFPPFAKDKRKDFLYFSYDLHDNRDDKHFSRRIPFLDAALNNAKEGGAKKIVLWREDEIRPVDYIQGIQTFLNLGLEKLDGNQLSAFLNKAGLSHQEWQTLWQFMKQCSSQATSRFLPPSLLQDPTTPEKFDLFIRFMRNMEKGRVRSDADANSPFLRALGKYAIKNSLETIYEINSGLVIQQNFLRQWYQNLAGNAFISGNMNEYFKYHDIMLQHEVQYVRLRDKMFVDHVKELKEKDPDLAIIALKGLDHRFDADYFSSEEGWRVVTHVPTGGEFHKYSIRLMNELVYGKKIPNHERKRLIALLYPFEFLAARIQNQKEINEFKIITYMMDGQDPMTGNQRFTPLSYNDGIVISAYIGKNKSRLPRSGEVHSQAADLVIRWMKENNRWLPEYDAFFSEKQPQKSMPFQSINVWPWIGAGLAAFAGTGIYWHYRRASKLSTSTESKSKRGKEKKRKKGRPVNFRGSLYAFLTFGTLAFLIWISGIDFGYLTNAAAWRWMVVAAAAYGIQAVLIALWPLLIALSGRNHGPPYELIEPLQNLNESPNVSFLEVINNKQFINSSLKDCFRSLPPVLQWLFYSLIEFLRVIHERPSHFTFLGRWLGPRANEVVAYPLQFSFFFGGLGGYIVWAQAGLIWGSIIGSLLLIWLSLKGGRNEADSLTSVLQTRIEWTDSRWFRFFVTPVLPWEISALPLLPLWLASFIDIEIAAFLIAVIFALVHEWDRRTFGPPAAFEDDSSWAAKLDRPLIRIPVWTFMSFLIILGAFHLGPYLQSWTLASGVSAFQNIPLFGYRVLAAVLLHGAWDAIAPRWLRLVLGGNNPHPDKGNWPFVLKTTEDFFEKLDQSPTTVLFKESFKDDAGQEIKFGDKIIQFIGTLHEADFSYKEDQFVVSPISKKDNTGTLRVDIRLKMPEEKKGTLIGFFYAKCGLAREGVMSHDYVSIEPAWKGKGLAALLYQLLNPHIPQEITRWESIVTNFETISILRDEAVRYYPDLAQIVPPLEDPFVKDKTGKESRDALIEYLEKQSPNVNQLLARLYPPNFISDQTPLGRLAKKLGLINFRFIVERSRDGAILFILRMDRAKDGSQPFHLPQQAGAALFLGALLLIPSLAFNFNPIHWHGLMFFVLQSATAVFLINWILPQTAWFVSNDGDINLRRNRKMREWIEKTLAVLAPHVRFDPYRNPQSGRLGEVEGLDTAKPTIRVASWLLADVSSVRVSFLRQILLAIALALVLAWELTRVFLHKYLRLHRLPEKQSNLVQEIIPFVAFPIYVLMLPVFTGTALAIRIADRAKVPLFTLRNVVVLSVVTSIAYVVFAYYYNRWLKPWIELTPLLLLFVGLPVEAGGAIVAGVIAEEWDHRDRSKPRHYDFRRIFRMFLMAAVLLPAVAYLAYGRIYPVVLGEWFQLSDLEQAWIMQLFFGPVVFSVIGYLARALFVEGARYNRDYKSVVREFQRGDVAKLIVSGILLYVPLVTWVLSFKNPLLTFLVLRGVSFYWNIIATIFVRKNGSNGNGFHAKQVKEKKYKSRVLSALSSLIGAAARFIRWPYQLLYKRAWIGLHAAICFFILYAGVVAFSLHDALILLRLNATPLLPVAFFAISLAAIGLWGIRNWNDRWLVAPVHQIILFPHDPELSMHWENSPARRALDLKLEKTRYEDGAWEAPRSAEMMVMDINGEPDYFVAAWKERSGDAFTEEEQERFRTQSGLTPIEALPLEKSRITKVRQSYYDRMSGEVVVQLIIEGSGPGQKYFVEAKGSDTNALDRLKALMPEFLELRIPGKTDLPDGVLISLGNQGDLFGNFTLLPDKGSWRFFGASNEDWPKRSYRALVEKDGNLVPGVIRMEGNPATNQIDQVFFRPMTSAKEEELRPTKTNFVLVTYMLAWGNTPAQELLREAYKPGSDLRHVFRFPRIGNEIVFDDQLAQSWEKWEAAFQNKVVTFDLKRHNKENLDLESTISILKDDFHYNQKASAGQVTERGDFYIDESNNTVHIILLPSRYPLNALAVSADGKKKAVIAIKGQSGRRGANYWNIDKGVVEKLVGPGGVVAALDNGGDPGWYEKQGNTLTSLGVKGRPTMNAALVITTKPPKEPQEVAPAQWQSPDRESLGDALDAAAQAQVGQGQVPIGQILGRSVRWFEQSGLNAGSLTPDDKIWLADYLGKKVHMQLLHRQISMQQAVLKAELLTYWLGETVSVTAWLQQNELLLEDLLSFSPGVRVRSLGFTLGLLRSLGDDA